MKILHIVRQYAPGKGGLENYVRDLAQGQKKSGHDVSVLSLDRVFEKDGRALRAHEVIDDIAVQRISFLGTRQCFLPFLNPTLLTQYDIVHIHGLDQLADVIAFYSLFCKKLKKSLALTTHGLFFHTESLKRVKHAYLRTISRFTLSRMNKIFAISGNDAAILGKVGIHTNLLFNPITPFENVRGNGQDFIYIGRISENKRIKTLLEFYNILRSEKNNEIGHLHIVGSDAEGLVPDLRLYAKKLDLDDFVTFHGFTEQSKMHEILKTCRYNISASRYEGFGLAMVEGMSAGLLPVMHNNAAFTEIAERADLGFIGDFDQGTETVKKFLAWEETITDNMQDKAIAFALSQSHDAMQAKLETFYHDILDQGKDPDKNYDDTKLRPLCGLPINIETTDSAIAKIKNAIASKERMNVCFANTNLSVQLHEHAERQDILEHFDLILNDGIGSDLGSFIRTKKKFPDNLNGTDFVPNILRNIPTGTKIALYGAKDSVVKKAAEIFEASYGMKIVFISDGYKTINDIKDELEASGADILLVAQGNPLQEKTIMDITKAGINIPVKIGVGALFDFTAGTFKRAPNWMRSLRIEWLYRLANEPSRLLKRYTVDIYRYLRLVSHYGDDIK